MKKLQYIRRLVFVCLLSFLLVSINSCGGKQNPVQKEKGASDSPPSVSGIKPEYLVRLSAQEIAELKIQTIAVTSSLQNYSIAVPGVVFPAPNHISIISTPINGRISSIQIQEGEIVMPGQEMFRIESLEFGNMVSEYLQAVSEETFQTSRLHRLEQLVEQTISSKSELDRASSDYQRS